MKLTLITDGTPGDTLIVDPATREPLEDIVAYTLDRDVAAGQTLLTVTVRVPEGPVETVEDDDDEPFPIVQAGDRWYIKDSSGAPVPPGGMKSREAAEILRESMVINQPEPAGVPELVCGDPDA